MNSLIPVAIICIAVAAMMSPVSRIRGPIRCVFSNTLLIAGENIMKMKLVKIASASAQVVAKIPNSAVLDIAAAMVPGPAISGGASGTSERSVKFSFMDW